MSDKIYRIQYTFNYSGSANSSFAEPLEGLEVVLNTYNLDIPIQLIIPSPKPLTPKQEASINAVFMKFGRPPYFPSKEELIFPIEP